MINNKSIKNIDIFKEIYITTKVKECRNKKTCYKSPEWYEVLIHTTNSLQKQNTNSLQKQNTNQLNNKNNVKN